MAKKKVKIILQVIMLVLVFVFLVAFMEIDGNIKYFETNYNEGDQTVAYVIETKEELELYVTDEEVLSNYEEEFFNDKHLVLVVVVLESCNIKTKITDYTFNEGEMEVTVLKDYPEYGLMMMKTVNMLIEVDVMEINEVNIVIKEK